MKQHLPICVLAAIAISLGDSSSANASTELRDIASRVFDEWRKSGARVTMGAPRFLHDDETTAIRIPPAGRGACTTVVLIGARGMSFHARVVGLDPQGDDELRSASVAGVLALSRCDGLSIPRLVVTSDGGRGAIETLAATSASPLPSIAMILPERSGALPLTSQDPGDLPALSPPEKRAEIAEQRARRDRANSLAREQWRAGGEGTGSARLVLEAGCHRIEVFSPDARATRQAGGAATRLDLDAELRDDADDRLMARDRTDSPDARLEACVGEEVNASVVFAGAVGMSNVLATHAFWPIPEHVPNQWGELARARMASVLLARHVASPGSPPIFVAQGAAGTTPIPISIEPGACYLAVVAVAEGGARGIGLRASVGAREANDERGSGDNAAAVAFCAQQYGAARLEVDARGATSGFGLAVFRIQGGVWEALR